MKNIYLIVGPSGVGKTTVVDKLSELYGYKVVESYTTRPRRTPDETGHRFVSDEEFDALGELCAYTEFSGYRYGVPSSMVDECDLYVIDPYGVEYMKEHYKGRKGVKVIGLEAVDIGVLIKRMQQRGDSAEEIDKRLDHDRNAFRYLSAISDRMICNFNLERTVQQIKAYIDQCEQPDEMLYYVTCRVEGTVTVEVSADNADDARKKANTVVEEMDFGELENIEWDTIATHTENL